MNLLRFLRLGALTFALAASCLTGASASSGGVTFVLDNPNLTVSVPTTGTHSADFFATVTNNTSSAITLTDYFTYLPVNSKNDILNNVTFGGQLPFTLAAKTSYHGDLYNFSISPDTNLGLYDQYVFGGPALMGLDYQSAPGTSLKVDAPFSVNVVPEPAQTAEFGIGFLVLGSFLLRARHRRKSQTA